jgi:hypothetical protein
MGWRWLTLGPQQPSSNRDVGGSWGEGVAGKFGLAGGISWLALWGRCDTSAEKIAVHETVLTAMCCAARWPEHTTSNTKSHNPHSCPLYHSTNCQHSNTTITVLTTKPNTKSKNPPTCPLYNSTNCQNSNTTITVLTHNIKHQTSQPTLLSLILQYELSTLQH